MSSYSLGQRVQFLPLVLMAGFMAAIGYLALWALEVYGPGVDAGFSYQVYAKNLLDHGQLTFNVDGERIEGYASPLWLLFVILASLINSKPITAIMIFTALLVSAAVIRCIAYLEGTAVRDLPKAGVWSARSIIFLGLLLSYPHWVLWNLGSLMETGLFTCLLVNTVFLLAQAARSRTDEPFPAYLLGALIALIVIARPEGPLWAAWFVVASFIVLRSRKDAPAAGQLSRVFLIGAPLFALIALVAFRIIYFGYPLPNSFYNSLSAGFLFNVISGSSYLLSFLFKNAFAIVGAFVGIAWVRSALRKSGENGAGQQADRLSQGVVGGTILVGIVIYLLSGGEDFGGFRIYQPLLPILLVVFVIYLDRLLTEKQVLGYPMQQQLPKVSMAILFFALSSMIMSSSWSRMHRTYMVRDIELAYEQRFVAYVVRGLFYTDEENYPVLAEVQAGGLRSEWPGDVFDMTGANDLAMAHSANRQKSAEDFSAFDPTVFFEREPDIVGLRQCSLTVLRSHANNSPWVEDHPEYRATSGLTDTPLFRQKYRYVYMRDNREAAGRDPDDWRDWQWFCGYVHVDLLQELEQNEKVLISLERPTRAGRSELANNDS